MSDKLLDLAMPFDPPADRRNPYPDYARYRRESPVIESAQGDRPLVWAFRHRDVAEILSDHERFSNEAARVFLGPTQGEDLLVGMDPPAHADHRRLIMPAFGPPVIERWKADIIPAIVEELLDALKDVPDPDLVRDLAFVLPTRIIARILGLPDEDFPLFRAWTMEFITVSGDPTQAFESARALRSYLTPIIEARIERPMDDMISRLGAARIDGDRLSVAQVLSFLLTLLPAGIETTFRALGSFMFTMLSQPQRWGALVADESGIRPAVEELLRFEAPLQVVFRTARADMELSGSKIRAGSFVIPVIGSANRDEDANPEPDEFRPERSGRNYLTFGNGVHFCLGLHLAKAELMTAAKAMVRRFPRLALDTALVAERDIHIRGLMVRSPASVPVSLGK